MRTTRDRGQSVRGPSMPGRNGVEDLKPQCTLFAVLLHGQIVLQQDTKRE